MHQALYRKWRPRVFDDVYGQEHITSVLKYEVEHAKLSHAYLFCGSRGVGKTTCAKILAKAVNCESPKNGEPCGVCPSCLAIESGSATDVLEMDAASNNGVDNIRDIRDEVAFAPSLLKYRVYVVDEVHMLSTSAFNALLKTLEEPPEHVIFILATTELQKLPATIISRCQRFEFKRISSERLSARIELIAREEGIKLTPDASHLIARLSQGGMRDAISLLELCSGGDQEITAELVNETVGSTGRERTACVASAVAHKDYDTIFDEIAELVRSSKSMTVFWEDMLSFWRDMLIFKTTPEAARYLDLTDSETSALSDIASYFTRETLLWHCRLLDDALIKMNRSASTARMTAELTLLRMCDERLNSGNDSLLSRISKLEERLSSGAVEVKVESPATSAPEKKKAEDKPRKPEVKVTQPTIEAKKEAPSPAPVAAVGNSGGKRVLRPLRCWAEVLDDLSVLDMVAWIDLNGTKAFYDENDACVVVFDNNFMLERANTPDIKNRIAELIAQQTGKRVPVSFEFIEDKGEGDTVFDELLDNF